MPAQHINRIERLNRLEQLLPPQGTAPEYCIDGGALLATLGEAYGDGSPEARRRALQRDLKDLEESGRAQVANPGGKPKRYRRLERDPADDGPSLWDYTIQQIRDLVGVAVPTRQFDRLMQMLVAETEGVLDEKRLRIVPDAVRLQPAALYPGVLQAVLEALAQRCVLQVRYRNAQGERSEPDLHPLALVQRGPMPYLFALKNDEDGPVRLYALSRMTWARADPLVAARTLPGFDLDEAIAKGKADFGQGEMIDLELRVRGYLAQVLPVCPLAAGQRQEDEPEGADFELRVWARVPSTGNLLRWLLGAGDNLEVVAPADLRGKVAAQAAKAAALYAAGVPAGNG